MGSGRVSGRVGKHSPAVSNREKRSIVTEMINVQLRAVVVAGDYVVEESQHIQQQHTQTHLQCSSVAGRPKRHLTLIKACTQFNLYTTAEVYTTTSNTLCVQLYAGLVAHSIKAPLLLLL